jgi:tripeptide aminopeptidase
MGLANQLVEELKNIGMQDVTIDDKSYIMATLPSNVDHEVPTIVSHFDTTPDFTGANVKPQIIPNYDGKDIVLNMEQNIILSPDYFKELSQYKGQTLITTDGTTFLVPTIKPELRKSLQQWNSNQQSRNKHGKIRVGF